MKKLTALILALAQALSICACGQKTKETTQTAAAADIQTVGTTEETMSVKAVGTLSLLNMTEDETVALVEAHRIASDQMIKEGYAEELAAEPSMGDLGETTKKSEIKVNFYDTLDALLMALNAGDIEGIEIYQSVARYLCAANANLQMGFFYEMPKEQNTFAELVLNGVNGNDFAFMMMENNVALRDEFNTTIADMKADGTMDRLVKEQIDDLIDGDEISPIELPHFDGAETVKVAVTGALPPMDYVAADGNPAGFNTAVLAEIGQRTGKNIEIVVVDSIGRAAALASGNVDAVFWTRTSSKAQERAALTEAEREAQKVEDNANMTEEEVEVMQELSESIDFLSYGSVDMPEGTIVTEPYFSDVLVPVLLADGGPQGK